MARYQNKGGTHTMADGTVVKHGEFFDTEENVMAIFPNKFIKAVGVLPVPVNAPAAPAPTTPEGNEETGGEKGATGASDEAADVTADFPTAKDNGLTVKKDKAGYWITDDSDPVNEAAIRAKKDVSKAIATYLKG